MTLPPQTILVAVDFGPASTSALALAGRLAEATGASLRVLHAEALDAPPYFTPAQLEVLEGEAAATRVQATEYLRAYAQPHLKVPFEAVVDNRVPTDAILRAATAVDLVVMGTHGRRGPSRWWLGSVAERVLRETHTPLLVVHAGVPGQPGPTFREGMILAPAIETPAPRTRALAGRIAGAFAGTVFTVTTTDPSAARRQSGATWVAVPVPTPPTAHWLAHVGEPLVKSCAMPVLFVPEAQGGATA